MTTPASAQAAAAVTKCMHHVLAGVPSAPRSTWGMGRDEAQPARVLSSPDWCGQAAKVALTACMRKLSQFSTR
jgi:hypothetical protein